MLEESDGTRPPFRHIPCVQWVRLAGGRATRCKRVTRRAGTANITHCTPASCGVRLVALMLLMRRHTQKQIMQPPRGCQDTGRCQKLFMQQHASVLLAPSASFERDAYASKMHVASQGLARHRQVSEAMPKHSTVLIAPSTSHDRDAHALQMHQPARGWKTAVGVRSYASNHMLQRS